MSRVRSPDLPSRLAHAFGTGFWWAFAIATVAVVPILFLPAPAAGGLSSRGRRSRR